MTASVRALREHAGEGRGALEPRDREDEATPERALLAEVDAACADAERDPGLLARPLRVVVPSRGLRETLCEALVDRAGRSRVGVRVQTLDVLAREVLERSGRALAPSRLFPVAVRERSRREPALARALDSLDDGHAALLPAVDDLLDAGFVSAHLAALEERVADAARGASGARALALLRVSADLADEIARGELGHRSALFANAAECLADDVQRALPTRALWIQGFADATGVQLDLLEALATRCEARVWLARPAEAADSEYGARLRERLAPFVVAVPDASPSPCDASRHRDPESECRAAALWAREQLRGGARPERVAIVSRDLGQSRVALRRHLTRLGLPFSGQGEPGAAGPAARRLAALLDLLERGGALPTERWLEALAPDAGGADLRDALHVRGIATLAELERADALGEVQLPARTRIAADDEGLPRAMRRRVPSAALSALQRRARQVLSELAAAPEHASLAERLRSLRATTDALGWQADTPGRAELDEAFPDAEGEGGREIRRSDWPRLLRRILDGAGHDALGGAGGGVQLLSIAEARERHFDALRVIALNRGVFPRRISEDPLLPDALRRELRELLPDLPVKGEGHDEERFLFAQLRSAAPRLHLSCTRHDAEGRAAIASPFFERIGLEPPDVADAESPSAHDGLLRCALHASREDFAAALPDALAAGASALGVDPAGAAAAAQGRIAVLRELDARGAQRHLSPHLGSVGPPTGAEDPRSAPPSVSDLEAIARCPWRAFLERMLRLAPPPDVHGPLPAAGESRLIGNVVHQALEQLCDPEGEVDWPAEVSDEALLEAAHRELAGAGIVLPGFARGLARRARHYVEVARRLDAGDPAEIVEVESRRVVEFPSAEGAPHALRFRADRVERRADGALVFTDWKTGGLKVDQKKSAARRDAHAKQLAKGAMLQAHVYARAGGLGRFVFLDPTLELADPLRIVEAEGEGVQREVFEEVVAGIFEAYERGAFPPRMRLAERDEEPRACEGCDLKPACLRGDSGARRHLGSWAEAQAESDASATEIDRAALALWRLEGAGS